ncbi:hypothetical protein ACIQ9Q_41485 [Streptomyces sp. NPDC094438]|uniref:hypothetical protein n=1 Tax=Streptomyces sp. NPDC094438 TaxID=3366061 RepID=UPI003807BB60
MPVSTDWVRQNIASDTLTLDAHLLDLGDPTDYLFSDDYLGRSWTVTTRLRNADALVAWGRAPIKGQERDVEVHFLCAPEDPQTIAGIAIYGDLADNWNPSDFPDLNLQPLQHFEFRKPEVALIVEPGYPYPLIEGSARYGTETGVGKIPNRFCVRRTSPGFSDLYSRFGSPSSSPNLTQIIASLPFPLPSANTPQQVQTAISGLSLPLSHAEVTIQEDNQNIVSASITVNVGELGRDIVIIPGFFTANALDITLQLSGRSQFLVGAEFTGKIGQTSATASASYASGGNVRIMGAVRNVALDPVILNWLKDALGTDVTQALSAPTVETMAVEANITPSSTALSAGAEIKIPIHGSSGDAYLAITASKQASKTYTVSTTLEFPFPSPDNATRRVVFQGTASKQNDTLTFILDWEAEGAPKDPEVCLSDILRLFGADDLGLPDICLSSLKAVYRPTDNFLLLEAKSQNVEIALLTLKFPL